MKCRELIQARLQHHDAALSKMRRACGRPPYPFVEWTDDRPFARRYVIRRRTGRTIYVGYSCRPEMRGAPATGCEYPAYEGWTATPVAWTRAQLAAELRRCRSMNYRFIRRPAP